MTFVFPVKKEKKDDADEPKSDFQENLDKMKAAWRSASRRRRSTSSAGLHRQGDGCRAVYVNYLSAQKMRSTSEWGRRTRGYVFKPTTSTFPHRSTKRGYG